MTRPSSPGLAALLRSDTADLFPLPADIVTVRDALARLDADTAGRPDTTAALTSYGAAVLDAALTGQPIPDPAEVLAAEQAAREHALRSRAVRDAADRLASELVVLADDLHEELVTGPIRTAWTTAYTAGRTAVQTFTPHGSTLAELIQAPAKARAAWQAHEEAAGVMARLEGLVARLRMTGGNAPTLDEHDLCLYVLNLDAAYPGATRSAVPLHQLATQAPWPLATVERLRWSVTTGVELSPPPTPDEQDTRLRTAFAGRFAAAAEQHARGRSAMAYTHMAR